MTTKEKTMKNLSELLPANRVAAIVGFLTAIIAALVALKTSFVPGSSGEEAIAKALVILGALYKAMTIVTTFLKGAQNFDSLILSGQPIPGDAVVQAAASVSAGETPEAIPPAVEEFTGSPPA